MWHCDIPASLTNPQCCHHTWETTTCCYVQAAPVKHDTHQSTPIQRTINNNWGKHNVQTSIKIAMPIYKSIHSLTALYIYIYKRQLVANSGRHHRLWSADVDTCIVPRTNTQLGDRSFAVTESLIHGFGTLCQWNTDSQTLNLSHFGGY